MSRQNWPIIPTELELLTDVDKTGASEGDLLVVDGSNNLVIGDLSDVNGTVGASAVPDGGDATAIHDNEAGEIAAISNKATPVAGDHLLIEDSEASNAKKRVTWDQLPSGGGAETNDLETVCTGIAADEVPVGSGTDTAAYTSTTGTGDVVRKSSPTLTTPTIASMTNAQHDHADSAGGGALASGSVTAHEGSITHDNLISGTIAAHDTTATGAELDTLTGGGEASTLHLHDDDYYQESEHINSSSGAPDAGKPIVLDANGNLDSTFIKESTISHDNIADVGSNAHSQIDTHLGSTANPHGVDYTDVVSPLIHLTKTSSGVNTLTSSAIGNQVSITWDSQLHYDSGTFTHSTSTNSERITVAATGRYSLTYTVPLDAYGSSLRMFIWCIYAVNGTDIYRGANYAYTRSLYYDGVSAHINTEVELTSGQYIEAVLEVADLDAGTHGVTTRNTWCELIMRRIS